VLFKSTAGLHHAPRNADPPTGFEQHGFRNLLDRRRSGAGELPLLLPPTNHHSETPS